MLRGLTPWCLQLRWSRLSCEAGGRSLLVLPTPEQAGVEHGSIGLGRPLKPQPPRLLWPGGVSAPGHRVRAVLSAESCERCSSLPTARSFQCQQAAWHAHCANAATRGAPVRACVGFPGRRRDASTSFGPALRSSSASLAPSGTWLACSRAYVYTNSLGAYCGAVARWSGRRTPASAVRCMPLAR